MKIDCAHCDNRLCTEGLDCFESANRIREMYKDAPQGVSAVTAAAGEVESAGYMRWTRVQEVAEFARHAGFEHIGIAFCIGLADEVKTLADLYGQSFKVSSICCKACGIPKSEQGLPLVRKHNQDEVMCAPLAQAELLSQAGTELNITVGLCIGHDILFNHYSRAPVTALIIKDRVLGHNPAAALYSKYWKKQLQTAAPDRIENEKPGTSMPRLRPSASASMISPIGVIRSSLNQPSDTPIQGALSRDHTAEIELFAQFADGLADLDGFSHIILLYQFHRTSGYDLKVTPYLDTKERGLFSTRAPRRPNPIGMTVVRLEKIEGNRLKISGVDMLDKTPLLDIKPYVPKFDHLETRKNGWLGLALAQDDGQGEDRLADDRFHQNK